MIRPLQRDNAADTSFTIVFYYPSFRTTYNRDVPFGKNDGALWAGRGYSAAADVGAELRWRALTARWAPTIAWSENRSFELAQQLYAPVDHSPYADQWWSEGLDRPQRFGDKPFVRSDPGQSTLRIDWRGAAVGVSTANMWWGPGIENSILMTNNAAGFPHAFVGLASPRSIGIGTVELMFLGGRLYDSEYWLTGEQRNRNRRWISALVGVFAPRGAPGLYVGGGRVFYQYIPAGGLALDDILEVLQPFSKKKFASPENPTGNDTSDQMISLFARWVFPAVGFEVYGEYGRNDHPWDTRDLILQPDHATARLLGFRKISKRASGMLAVGGEASSLAAGRTIEVRTVPSWYASRIVSQGFTQRGQILGAAIGPGSDTQRLSTDWVTPQWSVGGYVDRTRYDSDGFYRLARESPSPTEFLFRNDVALSVAFRGALSTKALRIDALVLHSYERNRYSEERNDVHNVHVTVRAESRIW